MTDETIMILCALRTMRSSGSPGSRECWPGWLSRHAEFRTKGLLYERLQWEIYPFGGASIFPGRNDSVVGSVDLIWHF
jgi:hypothetical protein